MSRFVSTLRAAKLVAVLGAALAATHAVAWDPTTPAAEASGRFISTLPDGRPVTTVAGYGVTSAPFVKSALVQVDVYDRADRSALPVFNKDGRHYIVGAPGHEYAVRIRNCTGSRVLVVTSVDGVNVISGDTASPAQSGYVLEPWGSVEIAGWRKSAERIAAFYFTDLGDSYAARTGRPQNVGVIGVAVFPEKAPPRISWREENLARKKAIMEGDSLGAAKNEARAEAPASAAPAPAPSGARDQVAADERFRQDKKDSASGLMSKLGTGHGRNEDSRAVAVRFERASETPAETVAVQYDRRENLLVAGVLREQRPYLARREPNPFPGNVRFAPDPR
jgi:hypothetical protein